jgi:hypothetical protein
MPFAPAMRSGKLKLDGPSGLVREFPRWLKWSPMADNVRAAVEAARPRRSPEAS